MSFDKYLKLITPFIINRIHCTLFILHFITFCNTPSRWLNNQKPKHATHSTLMPVIRHPFVNNCVDSHWSVISYANTTGHRTLC